MRLTLFDRIRRLARSRKPAGDPAPAAEPWLIGPPGPGTPGGTPAPAGSGGPAGTRSERRVAGNHRGAGSPAVRSGAARARIREAPADAAPVGLGEAARAVPVAADHRAHWHETAPAAQAQAAAARSAELA